ncbi:hypothetical protein SAMN06296952_0289 [Oscillospiraceae bacterium]|nr:hypothetical protein SAMN06296952_0289 [Oscillospiraceae bacterium]
MIMDDKKREMTLEKMGFLLHEGYEMNEDDHGISFIKDDIRIYAFWGRYYDPVDISIESDKGDIRGYISVYKHYVGSNVLKMIRLPKDDLERFCVLADHFADNIDMILK